MIPASEEIDLIRRILREAATVAVIGLSPKPGRPSHRVARYLMAAGYRVIPVNPGQDEILDQVCYPNLRVVPAQVDLVNIFRNPAAALPVVEDAIAVGARFIWMQQGIVNHEAAARAEAAGLAVIMDRCIKIDHMNLL